MDDVTATRMAEQVEDAVSVHGRPGDLRITDMRIATVTGHCYYPILRIDTNQGITGLPLVCASYVEPMQRIDQVVGADWEAGMGVARLLLGLGHRRAAFVHGSTLPLGRAERLRGFRDGMAEAPDAAAADIVFDEADGFRGAFLSFLQDADTPTALFCAHDGIAVEVVSELLRLGVRVPDDVSVVGFNDFAAATQVVPRLTTVRTPQVAIGAAMVRCVVDRLGQPPDVRPPVRVSLVAEIVQRDSTARAAGTAWLRPLLARGYPPARRAS